MTATAPVPGPQQALEAVLARIGEGVLALDREGRCTYVNRHAAALLRREPDALQGQVLWDRLPPALAAPFRTACEAALASQQPQTFETAHEEFGQQYRNRAYPSPDGVSLVLTDVTAERAGDAEARRRGEHLRAVIAATPLAVVTLDLTGRVTGWHGTAEGLFGWRAAEVLGSLLPLCPPDESGAPERDPGRIAADPPAPGLELERLTRDGRRLPVSLSTAGLRDGEGTLVGAVLAYADITRRRDAERDRARHLAEVTELAHRLQAVREEERLRIAREIHDQLGQALTGLRLEAHWLATHGGARDAATQQHLDRLGAVADGLVATVRAIARELRPPLLDDLGLVEALDFHLREFQARTGIATEFEAPEAVTSVEAAVATGLFRIAQEGLVNVARHARATRVALRLLPEPGRLRLELEDDGVGFDPEPAPPGQTLGLVGMRERAAAMRGTLRVDSAPGAGTRIVVQVPHAAGAT